VAILAQNNCLNNIDWFLVGHANKSYQLDTLAKLGIPMDKVIQLKRASYFRVDKLFLPRLCGYNRQHHPSWKLSYLEQSFCGAQSKRQWRKLFISRSDASFRRLVGEDELMERLSVHGFEKITLAGLPLEDTIKLFAEAAAVIGPFGSGLMNIAFCQANTNAIEIASPEFYNCYHWYLSGVRGLNHAVYFGGNGVLDPRQSPNRLTKDISIDVANCYEFILGILMLNPPS
jgi:capsular polysaccharide biosynthesis protein